jgi:hypothetical protein
MFFLALQAYAKLIHFDVYLARGDFALLYDKVRNYKVLETPRPVSTVETVCRAVDFACIFYRKQVLCLQRSAATTCLLRRHGISAQMVIGSQQMPFKSHSWVEVAGRVVNDKAYMPEIYAVLDRC